MKPFTIALAAIWSAAIIAWIVAICFRIRRQEPRRGRVCYHCGCMIELYQKSSFCDRCRDLTKP